MARKVKMEAAEAGDHLPGKGISDEPVPGKEAAAGEDDMGEKQSKEEELMSRLQETEKAAAENYDRYLRVMAEFDNYRKRAVREKADAVKFGNENLLRDILPLMDNIDRAMDHACNSNDFDAFKQGLKMLQDQLMVCLQKHGVEQIEAVGKDFDPHVHEAMMQVDSKEHEERKVVGEFERGYLLNGRLLRPAKVSVCRKSRDDREDCFENGAYGENN
ncbi:MAG: nucleotide exchange factor GrpE [Thermodesulfobacteriota bacterium]